MGKIFRKNQVIITALAVMIAVAGYLNFSGKELNEYGLSGSGDVETSADALGIADGEVTTDISAEDMGDDTISVSDSGEAVSEETDKDAENGNAKEEGQEDGESSKSAGTEVSDKDNPGAAVLVTSMNVGYFASAKLSREQTRAQNKETLMSIVDNEKISESEKKEAIKSVVQLTKEAEQETDIETLLEAKGFDNVVVTIADKAADVIVGSNNLTEQQIAQIQDVVKRKSEIAAENIVITPVGISEEK